MSRVLATQTSQHATRLTNKQTITKNNATKRSKQNHPIRTTIWQPTRAIPLQLCRSHTTRSQQLLQPTTRPSHPKNNQTLWWRNEHRQHLRHPHWRHSSNWRNICRRDAQPQSHHERGNLPLDRAVRKDIQKHQLHPNQTAQPNRKRRLRPPHPTSCRSIAASNREIQRQQNYSVKQKKYTQQKQRERHHTSHSLFYLHIPPTHHIKQTTTAIYTYTLKI